MGKLFGRKSEVVDAETLAENSVVDAVSSIETLVSNIEGEIENATSVADNLKSTKADLLATADRYQTRIERVEKARETLGRLLAVLK